LFIRQNQASGIHRHNCENYRHKRETERRDCENLREKSEKNRRIVKPQFTHPIAKILLARVNMRRFKKPGVPARVQKKSSFLDYRLK